MALPIVIVTSGGIAITESTNGIGLPVEIAENGFGIAARFVDSGGLAVLGGASSPPVVVPAAPALTWASLDTDDEPDFDVDLPSGNVDPIQDAAEDDELVLEYQLQSGGAWTEYLRHTLTAGDISGDEITVSGVDSVPNGDYFFRARLERGALIGTNSANVEVTIDASTSVPVNSVAPVISGNTQITQTLSTTDGTWSNTPTGYTYQWKRDGSSIGSATANTYALVELDAGADITCEVTASNASGPALSATASNSLTIDVYAILVDHIEDATDLTIYSGGDWNSVSLGVAAANRKIVLGIEARGTGVGLNATISSLTVAGNATAQVTGSRITSDGGAQKAEFQAVDLASGASGNLVLTWSAGQVRCGCNVWAVYGAAAGVTPNDVKSSGVDPSGTLALAVPAKGVGLGVSFGANGVTVAWTGLTASHTTVVESTSYHSAATINSSAGGTINTTIDWSATQTVTPVHSLISLGI